VWLTRNRRAANRSMRSPSGSSAVILFDGVCNLCNAWVNFVIDRDPSERFSFGAQQSAGGQALLGTLRLAGRDLAGIILVADDSVFTDSTAIIEICARLPAPSRYLAWLRIVPRPVRDTAYRWVARHRYEWFGTSATCRVPTPELRRRFLSDAPR
jgi:predicted DCC family thiol-disulfide oxidoreductase YuxK